MKLDKKKLRLYAVTDRRWSRSRKEFLMQIEEALSAGVTCVQLREKNISLDEFLSLACEIKSLCKKYNKLFIVNDNLEVCIKSDADGIHVGQTDMNVIQVRNLIGNNKFIGVSVSKISQGILAQEQGADYIGVGSVFKSKTKLDINKISRDELIMIRKKVSLPIVAIGGINKNNLRELKNIGLDGVAIASGIFASDNIKLTCENLCEILTQII